MGNKRINALKVAQIENRGDNEVPYGFVYFSDGTRIGYAPTTNRPIFESSDDWGPVTLEHFELAIKSIKKQFGVDIVFPLSGPRR